jgi:hypothetical protein
MHGPTFLSLPIKASSHDFLLSFYFDLERRNKGLRWLIGLNSIDLCSFMLSVL